MEGEDACSGHLELPSDGLVIKQEPCDQTDRTDSGSDTEDCSETWDADSRTSSRFPEQEGSSKDRDNTDETEDRGQRGQSKDSSVEQQTPNMSPEVCVKTEPEDPLWDHGEEKSGSDECSPQSDSVSKEQTNSQPTHKLANTPASSNNFSQLPYISPLHPPSRAIGPKGGSSNKRTRTAPKGRSKERPYECEICQAAFTQTVYLKRHLRTHSDEKPWKCEECGKAFIRRSQLQVHARSHSGEKPYKCNLCDASFSQTGHLQVHKRTHTGEKPFPCKLCNAAFTTSSHLSTHTRSVHTNNRPFECLVCGMAFTTPANLRIHCRTHSGEKPYKCNQCDASFTQSSNLKQHQARHAYAKPHACQVCDMQFPSQVLLQRHLKVHEREEVSIPCTSCEKTFATASKLQEHVRKEHRLPRVYSCEFCWATFTQSCNLKRHMLTHSGVKPFPCPHCEAAFKQVPHLQRHLERIHGEDGQECRPHKCPECPSAFTRVSDLKRHRKQHGMSPVTPYERTLVTQVAGEVLSKVGDHHLLSGSLSRTMREATPEDRMDQGAHELDERDGAVERRDTDVSQMNEPDRVMCKKDMQVEMSLRRHAMVTEDSNMERDSKTTASVYNVGEVVFPNMFGLH